MPCPYSVHKFLPNSTAAGGSWVYGYPCDAPSLDPVTGACATHQKPRDLDALVARILRT